MIYPVSDNLSLHLSAIQAIRGRFSESTYIQLYFSNSNRDIVAVGNTLPFNQLDSTKEDYKIDLVDKVTNQGCGCIVVTYKFMQWLQNLPGNIHINRTDAIMVNSLYVARTLETGNSYIRINDKLVDNINLENVYIKDGKMYLTDKVNNIEEESGSLPMTALYIEGTSTTATLKGKSIGFTITPSEESKTDDPLFCRVHIQTEPGRVTFIDQSRGV